jgi:hypothetical protein
VRVLLDVVLDGIVDVAMSREFIGDADNMTKVPFTDCALAPGDRNLLLRRNVEDNLDEVGLFEEVSEQGLVAVFEDCVHEALKGVVEHVVPH